MLSLWIEADRFKCVHSMKYRIPVVNPFGVGCLNLRLRHCLVGPPFLFSETHSMPNYVRGPAGT